MSGQGTATAKSNEWTELSPRNIVALLMLAGMVVGGINWAAGTSQKADAAVTAVEQLKKEKADVKDVQELKDDVKEIKRDIKDLLRDGKKK